MPTIAEVVAERLENEWKEPDNEEQETADVTEDGGVAREEARVDDANDEADNAEATDSTSGETTTRSSTPTQEDLNRLRSTYDKRIAALQKELVQAKIAEFERQIADLPEAEQQAAREAFKLRLENQILKNRLDEAAALEERAAKAEVVRQLSKRYGVPAELLQDFDTPQSMVKAAETFSKILKTAKLEQRKANHADRTESGSSGQAASEFDRSQFVNTGDIAGAIRAMQRAGQW